jgi:hypothetical protein
MIVWKFKNIKKKFPFKICSMEKKIVFAYIYIYRMWKWKVGPLCYKIVSTWLLKWNIFGVLCVLCDGPRP